jgi:hypothetical protein
MARLHGDVLRRTLITGFTLTERNTRAISSCKTRIVESG